MSHEFQMSKIERELGMQSSYLKRQLKRKLITREVFNKGMANIRSKEEKIEEQRRDLKRKRR